jgi:DNA-binding MarR family transcriptional regulator
MLLVRLTKKGRTYLDKILPDYFRRVSALMLGLSDSDRKTLVLLMTKIGDQVATLKD